MVAIGSTISTVNAGELSLYLVWNNELLVSLAVACPHPENGFQEGAERYGLLIDAAIEVAVSLAGFEGLDIDNSYFQRKASMILPNVWRTETLWSLRPGDSRVMLICRMRRWEHANNALIAYEEIPRAMLEAYAERLGIFDRFEEFMSTLVQGKEGLVEAILLSYTEASQRLCAERAFDKLIKANENQKALGFQASLKARDNRMAEADARDFAKVEDNTTERIISVQHVLAFYWAGRDYMSTYEPYILGFAFAVQWRAVERSLGEEVAWKSTRGNIEF